MFLNQLKGEECRSFMHLAYEMMLSDGIIAQEEKDMISAYTDEMRLESYEHNKGFEKDAYRILSKLPNSLKRELYIELYALAICEGDFDEEEKKLLKKTSSEFKITDEKCRELEKMLDKLNQVYSEMYGIIYE